MTDLGPIKVGDRFRSRDKKEIRLVVAITKRAGARFPVYAQEFPDGDVDAYTPKGDYYSNCKDFRDLVERVT